MKRAVLLAVLSAFIPAVVWAGEMPEGWAPPKPSAELERVKALEGVWVGPSKEKGVEGRPITISYKVTSGGSAVVEAIDPGTPHEMVSMYHDKNGKLSMTHYCMLGNQPELELKKSGKGKLELGMTAESHAALSKEMHMHSLTLETSGNSLTQTWTSWSPDGKSAEPTVFKLQRSQ